MATAELIGEQQPYTPGEADSDFGRGLQLGQVIAFGGLGTSQLVLPLYAPLLEDPDSPLSNKKRFIPPLKFGTAPIQEMIGHAIATVEKRVEQLQEPVDAEGHSLGGPILIAAALEKPHLFNSVTLHGGINFGVTKMTPGAKLLELTVGKIAGGTDAVHADSAFMVEQRRRVAEEWPEDIPISLIATVFDDLVLPRDALRIELPAGQRAERKIAIPWYFANELGRKKFHIPHDIGFIPTANLHPVTHYNMPNHGQLVDHHHGIRDRALSVASYAMGQVADLRPHLHVV